jgi:hypothetical protein
MINSREYRKLFMKEMLRPPVGGYIVELKKTLAILALLFLSIPVAFGQYEKVPTDMTEALAILQAECPDEIKMAIKKANKDSLMEAVFPWSKYKELFNWIADPNSLEKTALEKYFSKYGITDVMHIETIILMSFHAHLNKVDEPFEKLIEPFQLIEKKWAKEDRIRFKTDSLRGCYIPKNLEDCFVQIDKQWSDSTKAKVRKWTEPEFLDMTYDGFGVWIRNNWQLWNGSRLMR